MNDRPKKTSINVAMDQELLDRVIREAALNERTVSGQIRWYCREGVGR